MPALMLESPPHNEDTMDEKFRQMVEDAIKTDIRNANEAFLESLKIDREWLEANQTGGWAR